MDHRLLNHINPILRRSGIQSNEWNTGRKIYDYEIMYCIDGDAKLCFTDEEIHMRRGTFLIIEPNKTHTFFLNDKKSLIYWIHFDFYYFLNVDELDNYCINNNQQLYANTLIKKEFIRPVFSAINSAPSYIHIEDDYFDEIAFYFQKTFRLYTEKPNFWVFEAKSCLINILTYYFKQINQIPEPIYESQAESVYLVISSYIIDNYYRKITVEETARLVNLCPDYANKLFRDYSGYTIGSYVNKVRLDNAKKMITESNMEMKEIAYRLGFSNQNYFSRFIKKETSMSPIELKKYHDLNR